MKKIYGITVALIISVSAKTQETNTYHGAFAPAPTESWTNDWVNWNPQLTNYNPTFKEVIEVISTITTNTTWNSDKVYLLKGQIFVTDNATLTIPAGTIVMGEKAALGACLVITRGAKLIANGTKTSPIVFTSDQDANSRTTGDWGGIVILGKAKNNQAGGQAYIEGFANSTNTQFGGSDDADSSGSLKFVRIEYCGFAYAPNKEINGLTLGSVGSGTKLENIQVSYCNDDAFEWFGGTVNAKYLVSYRNLDDDFDTDYGYRGKVQFALGIKDPTIADNPSVSTSEGIESDNDATGSNALPQTSATFSNITLVGPLRGNPSASTSTSFAAGHRRAVRIRRNSAQKVENSIFIDFKTGLHIDGIACETNTTTNNLVFKNNIIAGRATTGKFGEVNAAVYNTDGTLKTAASTFKIYDFLLSNNNDTITSSTGILTNPYDYFNPDYRPQPVAAGIKSIETSISQISIYPNPSEGDFSLKIESEKNHLININISDISGKIVNTITNTQLIEGLNTIDFKELDLNQGTYFVTIQSNGIQKTIKLAIN
jgi:hypothetical protein